uniref:Uncharacterized protein n=1 Tax=Panagrolaimus davidi TaxID=227884 RepID=A0A914NZS4_9BILA
MYSYYCRFFPDDKDIFDEYENAVKEFKYIFFPFVSWKNPFKFEIFDENVETPKEPIIQPVESTSTKQPITCYFTANTISTPNYPFRSPLMNYIFQNSSPEIFQKLYETCKYYFQNLPTPFWYKLEITNDEKKFAQYEKYSAKFGLQRLEDTFFENIHLSTVLSVKRSNDNLTLSKCLPKLFKCDAKYISISSQDLTEMEFKFLIESKRVIELELENTYIFDENGEGIILDIVRCNSETSKIISELPFENKIEAFQLNNIPDESLLPNDFAEFITVSYILQKF